MSAWPTHRHVRRFLARILLTAWMVASGPLPAFASWTTDGNALGPRLINEGYSRTVADGTGGMIVTWMETRDCDHANIYAQHLNAAGAPLWGTDGTTVCTAIDVQGFPHIVSDMAGGAIIFWQDSRGGPNSKIYAQRINGLGATQWLPDGIPITSGPGWHGLMRSYIHAAISDGIGGAYIVFENHSVGIGDIYIQHIKDNGAILFPPDGLLLSQGTGHGIEPAIAADVSNGALVAWTDSRGGTNDIFAQRITYTGVLIWAAGGVPVCTAPGNQIREQLVGDGAGGAIVSWQDSRILADPDIYAQHLNAGGVRVWAPLDGIDISPVTSAQLMPQVVTDKLGGAIIAWTDTRPGVDDGIYAQRMDGGGAQLWPGVGGMPICTVLGTQTIERITEDGAGGAILTWNDDRIDPNGDLYAQRVNGAGAFLWGPPTGVPVSTETDEQTEADIVSNGAGGANISWNDARGGPPGPSDDGWVLYGQHLNGGGVPLWHINGNIVSAPGAAQRGPSIVTDGAGGSITAWEDYRDGCSGNIYVQHLDAGGVAQCGFDGKVVCGQLASQQSPQACSDGAGGAIIAWLDFRNGNADIYAQRVDGSGTSLWAADGVKVCTDPGALFVRYIVACQSGGAIIVWEDQRFGGSLIYAQKITDTGVIAAGWPVDGMPASTFISSQTTPQVTTDKVNGCVIAWKDHRAANDDIYAQRIDEFGVRRWAPGGVVVCGAPLDQARPQIANDGGNGAIVTWEDNRAGNTDIYARRVDATGTPIWTPDGVLVYGDPTTQSKPVITTDVFGNSIISWQDARGGPFDIYAQKISVLGSLLWPAVGVPVCVSPGPQQDPSIAADGGGGALIAWRDTRTGVDDIYVQRIDPSGAPHCMPDGVGGGVVAWTDRRGTQFADIKVYAMRIPPECGSLATGVEDEGAPAVGNRLLQNEPNPFNPSTVIAYEMAKGGHVTVAVFDISGRLIRTLVNADQPAGIHQVRWDGGLDSGAHAASGAYFYRIKFPSGAASTKKMILLK